MDRVCRVCGSAKGLSSFARDKTGLNGRKRICLDCYRKQQNIVYNGTKNEPAKRAARRVAIRRHDLKRKYGITPEAYDAMHEAQSGKCAICGLADSDRRLAVDHCHKSGSIGKLLCKACNHGLGKFRDSADLLLKAADYLKAHR